MKERINRVVTGRDYRLDLLRVMAMSMIVLMHSPHPENDAPGFVHVGISYVTAPGLVLFFMLSGALLLGSCLPSKEFFKKRFSKIVWPTLFWTFFYIAIDYIKSPTDWTSTLKMIGTIPFSSQGNGVLWFMYTLAGLYLLTPILSRWLRAAAKREIEFYLFLWFITLLYPYLSLVVDINKSDTGIFYYFAGYVGYFVFGYYLRHYYIFKAWHVVLAISAAVIIPAVLYSSGIEPVLYRFLWYLSLPCAMMAFSWYVMMCRLTNKRIPLIEKASSISFGVYFVHIFIMRDVIWNISFIRTIPDVPEFFVIALITIVLSYLIAWLISCLPFSKYIIGV